MDKNFKFTANNGMCPSCVVGDTQYYIQDVAGYYSGTYTYDLMKKSNKKQTVIKFNNQEELAKFIKDNDLDKSRLGSYIVLIDKKHRRIRWGMVDDLVVHEYIPTYRVCGDFESYRDCLSFAKKYLANEYADK